MTCDHLESARQAVARSGGAPLLDDLRLEWFEEGLGVQTLHVGAYDDEGPLLEAMHHQFIPAQALRMTGRHHEIYLQRSPPYAGGQAQDDPPPAGYPRAGGSPPR